MFSLFALSGADNMPLIISNGPLIQFNYVLSAVPYLPWYIDFHA